MPAKISSDPKIADDAGKLSLSRLDFASSCDRKKWDKFVDNHPLADVFHKSQWGVAVREAYGFDCYYLYVSCARKGSIEGVFPLIHCRSRIFGDALISVCFGTGGGILTNSGAAEKMLTSAAADLMHELGVNYVENRSNTSVVADWQQKSGRYAVFCKPLLPDKQARLMALSRKRRAEIRHAASGGVSICNNAEITDFFDIFSRSMRDLGTPVHAIAWFRSLAEQFAENMEVSLVSYQGMRVGACMCFFYKGCAHPFYAGTSNSAKTFVISTFLYWNLMNRAVNRDCMTFNFGRSRYGTGSFRYKELWGFEPTPITYSYLLKEGMSVPEADPDNKAYQRKIEIWKKLPLWLANGIGPFFARQIG